jgi:hypothetical protein
VKWSVEFHKDFDPEFDALPDDVQNELRAHALLLEQFGPQRQAPRRYAQRFAPREYEGVAF